LLRDRKWTQVWSISDNRGKGARLLTARARYGKARAALDWSASRHHQVELSRVASVRRTFRGFFMVKPEWGTKRNCPKCGTRFYDLGKDAPVTCIECGEEWNPEPVLKSKQPIPYEEEAKTKKLEEADTDLADDDLDIDDDGDSPDNDVDLGGDDDLGVGPAAGNDEDET